MQLAKIPADIISQMSTAHHRYFGCSGYSILTRYTPILVKSAIVVGMHAVVLMNRFYLPCAHYKGINTPTAYQPRLTAVVRHMIGESSTQGTVSTLGTLQLRRVLRAVELPTDGLHAELAERVREAVASGRLASFAKQKRVSPSGSFQCGESQNVIYHIVKLIAVIQ